MKLKLLNLLKLFVSLTLLIVLAYKLDWNEVFAYLSQLAWWAIPGVLIFQLLQMFLGTMRWQVLLHDHAINFPFFRLFQTFLSACFLNNVLPSTVGGDFYRIYHIFRQKHGSAKSISPILTERVFGVFALIILASIALAFVELPPALAGVLPTVLLSAACALIAGLVFLATPWIFRPVYGIFARWQHIRIIGILLNIVNACHSHVNQPIVAIKIALISLLMQTTLVAPFWLLGMGLGTNESFATYLLVIPIVAVIASIPISFGGLGLREASAVALFSAMGMNIVIAGTIMILYLPILYLSNLPGMYFFLHSRHQSDNGHKATIS